MSDWPEARKSVRKMFRTGDYAGACRASWEHMIDDPSFRGSRLDTISDACLSYFDSHLAADPCLARDAAVALAFAADLLPDGERASGTYDGFLGPLYAACLARHAGMAQGANLAEMGAHGWEPGTGTGDAILAGMADDFLKRVSEIGLSDYIPKRLPDGFGDTSGPYTDVPSDGVMRRALAAMGMTGKERADVCGRLFYLFISDPVRAGSGWNTALVTMSVLLEAASGSRPEEQAVRLRVCTGCLAEGLGMDVATDDSLAGAVGLSGLLRECRRAAARAR